MNKRYIEIVGDDGIRYFTKVYVRSRKKRPVNLDRCVTLLMGAWMYGVAAVITVALLRMIF